MKTMWLCVCLVAGYLAGGSTHAVMLQVTGGILTGATGVNVGGTLYSVSFQDGTCAELFSGCDSDADFLFNQVTGNLAAQALLDQVFLDGPDGPFDSAPQMTRGYLGAAL